MLLVFCFICFIGRKKLESPSKPNAKAWYNDLLNSTLGLLSQCLKESMNALGLFPTSHLIQVNEN